MEYLFIVEHESMIDYLASESGPIGRFDCANSGKPNQPGKEAHFNELSACEP